MVSKENLENKVCRRNLLRFRSCVRSCVVPSLDDELDTVEDPEATRLSGMVKKREILVVK